MPSSFGRKAVGVLLGIGAIWLCVRYALPVALPFLFGAVLAFAAEPVVHFFEKSIHMPRALAAGIGVTGVLLTLITLLSLLGAVVVRELGSLVQTLPDLQQTAREGIALVQNQMALLADSAPEGVRPLLTNAVSRFFSDGTEVMDQLTDRIPGVVGAMLSAVPDGALGIGTGILAGFMISARMPKLRTEISRHIPEKWKNTYFPALGRIRGVLGGWLKAQLILCLVTYSIVTVGFLLMKIPYGPAWAALVAIVDAVPLLGTGTVLIPCALVSLFQGETVSAIFYLAIYGIAAGVRAALEPRLVGKNLGIDPLVTLIAIYTGYRFFGFLGLVLAPMAVSVIMQIINAEKM